MSEEFDLSEESKGKLVFDFRGYLFKVLNLWKFVVFCIGIGLLIAYFINVRKQNVYRLDSLINVENEQNPFFTANTSISFNWGGVSGKVGKVLTAIKTRTHNEAVVDSLEFYMSYFSQGKYRLIDIYKQAPFEFKIDKSQGQILGTPVKIRFLSSGEFEVSIPPEVESFAVQRYDDKSKYGINDLSKIYPKTYKLNDTINLPFLNGVISRRLGKSIKPDSEYFIQFSNFDGVVNKYKNLISIRTYSASSSVLQLSLSGTNKAKIVDYLNTTAQVLSEVELKRKNLYASNTIKFIDSSLNVVNLSLKDITDEMNDFRQRNKVFDVNEEMQLLSEKLRNSDLQKEEENTKLQYLNRLEEYLNSKTDYTNIAAPSSVGITDNNISSGVTKIISLSIDRQRLEYTTKESSPIFRDLDRQITAEKNVLIENIASTRNTISLQLKSITDRIANLELQLQGLPRDQQEYLKIQRKMNISQEAYDVYLAKRSEAAIVKAANVSDIAIIDEAKDIGGGLIGPNKSLNYMMGLMMGFFIPMFFIFVIYLLDNTIHGSDEIEQLSSIPILGLIGKYVYKNNLVVFDKPKSAVAESFRSMRSSLQFIFKNQATTTKAKTLMVTSSVSGEGKTFCSINMATVYALTGKKTILLGLDLRKPKIFGDFDITNDKGVVNYLIGEATLDEIVVDTHIPNMSIIPSGPVPPNPSELLMGNHMRSLIDTLKDEYDILILDTPPLGLVTDAFEIANYADATLFMIRLDYTKKGMLSLINAKYKAGEIKNVSFVLNFYKHKTNHNYGYGYGYGYGYSYGIYGEAYHERDKKSVFGRIKRFLKRI